MDSEQVRRKGYPGRNRAAVVSFALALGVSVALLVVPTSTTVSACFSPVTGQAEGASASPAEPCSPGVSHQSLLESQGWGVAIPLLVPVLISGIALSLARMRVWRAALVTAAWLLFGFVLVGGFSIGPFYLPSALAMFVAGKPERKVLVAT
jgi:hypothetical protein